MTGSRSRQASADIEVPGDSRTYSLEPVAVEEFDFVNVYGTDITAARSH